MTLMAPDGVNEQILKAVEIMDEHLDLYDTAWDAIESAIASLDPCFTFLAEGSENLALLPLALQAKVAENQNDMTPVFAAMSETELRATLAYAVRRDTVLMSIMMNYTAAMGEVMSLLPVVDARAVGNTHVLACLAVLIEESTQAPDPMLDGLQDYLLSLVIGAGVIHPATSRLLDEKLGVDLD